MKTTDLEDRIAKQEREMRILRRVQIALFILIWGTNIVVFSFIVFRLIFK